MSRRVRRVAPVGMMLLLGMLWCGGLTPSAGFARSGSLAKDVGQAVEGVDRSRLLPPAGAEIAPYENAGYRLVRVGDEATVTVDASPLDSMAPFEAPAATETSDSVLRLARAVTLGATSRYEAVSRVLGWVARNLEYELDRSAPQDAESVLERRSAYCTGVARTTVALLLSVGIEAREVAGYVADDGLGGPAGYHRWIEVNYPDRGWSFSDPLYSHHFVPATYLRLASESIFPEGGFDGLLLERQNSIAPVDLYPAAVPGIRARRNSPRQLAAAVHVQVAEESTGFAVLEGNATRRTRALIDGETTFVGLEPGEYRLLVRLAGDVMRRNIRLDARQRASISMTSIPVHPALEPPARTPRSR